MGISKDCMFKVLKHVKKREKRKFPQSNARFLLYEIV